MATVEVSKECLLAMDKAKVALMMKPDSVFFTTLCFSMKHVWSDQIPTAATDGVSVFWNPVFFMELTHDYRVFLMLHETLHAAYLHVGDTRKGARCPDLWNKAGDYVINLQLVDRGFVMPTGKNKGLLDYAYKDMCVEEVYNLLEASPSSKSLPLMGDLLPTPEGLTGDVMESNMQDILVRAAVKSKMENDKPGTIPGDIQLFLDKLLNPKLPWNRILQKYLQAMVKNDYTWKKPNRRFFPQYHLPSMYSEGLIDIAIAADLSGSVTDTECLQFVTEIANILRMLKPKRLSIVQFDSSIRAVNEVKSIRELMKVKFTGRGGTQIAPVLKWAEENKPQLLLVFTDGEFGFPSDVYQQHIIWLIHGDKQQKFKPPFGKTIFYEI